ncbi:hypothetical protein BPUTEOMOX_2702 [methanotrophic endosymbiont of Bathymodiolus puteoserpentis (Logatchev)]|nr:hypothetical protein BPUTEOMOX_2702 [methanotrophic endosymbiont of Bathymodiolus puteoserpentis (Logatchev)]
MECFKVSGLIEYAFFRVVRESIESDPFGYFWLDPFGLLRCCRSDPLA